MLRSKSSTTVSNYTRNVAVHLCRLKPIYLLTEFVSYITYRNESYNKFLFLIEKYLLLTFV